MVDTCNLLRLDDQSRRVIPAGLGYRLTDQALGGV
jgi:hypothetical protein